MKLFAPLRNVNFARLYAAQTTSLLGDAFTWVGLALLAFELAGENSSVILAAALTLRVTAFVVLSPLAGALADRVDRKVLMVSADVGRMVVIGLMPFVNAPWQVYVLMFLLNALTAFFTPTYQATVPQVVGEKDYPQAIALSGATYEIFGVLGPGIAGAVATFLGAREIFYLDAATFLVSALLIITLPVRLKVTRTEGPNATTWQDVKEGTTRLWGDSPMRYALLLELVASVSGALVLVNTVGLVKGQLALNDLEYGWVMTAYGVGATVAALAVGFLDKRLKRTTFVFFGALVSTLAVLPANYVAFAPLLFFWVLAGAGQNWVNLPTQTLIADRTPEASQGRVYGAHFAWSHLWWAVAYPLAGWLGSRFGEQSYLYGALVAAVVLAVVQVFVRSGRLEPKTN
jgi:MFS transporter, NRE family, putaive nickel resistance protein